MRGTGKKKRKDRRGEPLARAGKGVAILGSTGSIGRSTLEVVESLDGAVRVVALAARGGSARLAEQVRRYRPEVAALADPDAARELAAAVADLPVRVLGGEAGVVEAACHPAAEVVVAAIVGAAGIRPTFAALRAGKVVALANKEALVAAGDLVAQVLAEGGGSLLPVDSEHAGVFQLLRVEAGGARPGGGSSAAVARIVLTASGGPFRTWALEEMERATPDQALQHPTWRMGGKVTVDSATLMNKGLEVLEARVLFGLPLDRIEVLVHPESLVHALVELVDGTILAQLAPADMRLPIQHALTFPERRPSPWPRLDLSAVGRLTFEVPDRRRFPALELAYAAGREGGSLPAVLNAANEVAVGAFLRHQIPFGRIVPVVERVMAEHRPFPVSSLDAVFAADSWARRRAAEILEQGGAHG